MLKRLPEIGASLEGEEFEENTLYRGEPLQGVCVLRLRRIGRNATLTFKRRIPGASAIKQQEKRRLMSQIRRRWRRFSRRSDLPPRWFMRSDGRWRLGKTEIVIDVLPFGLFMEIEEGKRDQGSREKAGLA